MKITFLLYPIPLSYFALWRYKARGVGEQNRHYQLSRTSSPSTLGGIWQTGFLFIGGRPLGGEGHYASPGA
jgi:hypothetical protein